MDHINIIEFFLSFAIVIGMILFIAWVTKKTGLHKKLQPHGTGDQLSIMESLAIDSRHRIVLIKCGIKEHLIIVGNNAVTVIDSDIKNTTE